MKKLLALVVIALNYPLYVDAQQNSDMVFSTPVVVQTDGASDWYKLRQSIKISILEEAAQGQGNWLTHEDDSLSIFEVTTSLIGDDRAVIAPLVGTLVQACNGDVEKQSEEMAEIFQSIISHGIGSEIGADVKCARPVLVEGRVEYDQIPDYDFHGLVPKHTLAESIFQSPTSIQFFNKGELLIDPEVPDSPVSYFEQLLREFDDCGAGSCGPEAFPVPKNPFGPKLVAADLLALTGRDECSNFDCAVPAMAWSMAITRQCEVYSCGPGAHPTPTVPFPKTPPNPNSFLPERIWGSILGQDVVAR